MADLHERPRPGDGSKARCGEDHLRGWSAPGCVRRRVLLRVASGTRDVGRRLGRPGRNCGSGRAVSDPCARRGGRLSLRGSVRHGAAASRQDVRSRGSNHAAAPGLVHGGRHRPRSRTAGPDFLAGAAAMTPILQSTLTCPDCGTQSVETMPNQCMRVFPHLRRLRHTAQAEARRLLRLLLLWLGSMSTDPGRRKRRLLCCNAGKRRPKLLLAGARVHSASASARSRRSCTPSVESSSAREVAWHYVSRRKMACAPRSTCLPRKSARAARHSSSRSWNRPKRSRSASAGLVKIAPPSTIW